MSERRIRMARDAAERAMEKCEQLEKRVKELEAQVSKLLIANMPFSNRHIGTPIPPIEQEPPDMAELVVNYYLVAPPPTVAKKINYRIKSDSTGTKIEVVDEDD